MLSPVMVEEFSPAGKHNTQLKLDTALLLQIAYLSVVVGIIIYLSGRDIVTILNQRENINGIKEKFVISLDSTSQVKGRY